LDLLRLLKDGGVNSKIGGVNSKSESIDGGVNILENELIQAIQTTPAFCAKEPRLSFHWDKDFLLNFAI
jgi:hypothetical protein